MSGLSSSVFLAKACECDRIFRLAHTFVDMLVMSEQFNNSEICKELGA
jgi:hypothetical protein